ncbi:DNA gyrase subunit A [Candidatus Woesearchaeota archaeon]|nr:DNA gyrase subunit A [Candidatus Woesearchaeota archaeon]
MVDETLAPKAPTEKIVPREINEEMKTSYLDYAMSVIVGRALPDARDGLKPVHRRILYAMNELGMASNKPFKKCARIVGEVLGKYHPHGDSAVYDSLVRMVQDFSLRYPLINGQGNFGSVDGDNAAAMRYTEARLSKAAETLLEDIEKETVNYQPNFDDSLKEPTVLPAKMPNLLVNGSSGIAVGMATNIPPHNLSEVTGALMILIDNPETSIAELMNYLPGPDFPTGATIMGKNGINSAYQTGKGHIKLKAKTIIEERKGRERIIVTELPYMVNKAALIEHIADMVKNKKIEGISDLRDESDRDGMRMIVELKKDASSDVVLNQLYKYSRLQVTFGVNMLALINNQPKLMNLKELLQHFIDHRVEVITRRTQYDLTKAQEKAHLLEGLIIALNDIDRVVELIKKSNSAEIAKTGLMQNYKLSETQAKAILEMRLQRLTGLEQEKIREEHKELLKLIEELKSILASHQKILDIIKSELEELKNKFSDARKTNILDVEDEDLDIEDLIEQEDVVVTLTHAGYAKRLPIDTYKSQRRGGKGIIATGTKEEDWVEQIFVSSTHDYLLFFTNKGKVHWLKVYKIPEASRQARGKAVINLLNLEEGEQVYSCIPIKEFDDNHYLLMATKNGVIKKTSLSAYSRPRKGGIIAINLDDNDQLINTVLTDGEQQIILASSNGKAVKFHERDARSIGRTSRGVRGISLKKGDELVGMVLANDEDALLTITENGFGKRTKISEYRLINRGGSGVINIQTTSRNGKVVSVKAVTAHDEVMLISKNGIIIRTAAQGISMIGRNTQGVRLMRMKSSDDKVVAAAKIITDDNGDE